MGGFVFKYLRALPMETTSSVVLPRARSDVRSCRAPTSRPLRASHHVCAPCAPLRVRCHAWSYWVLVQTGAGVPARAHCVRPSGLSVSAYWFSWVRALSLEKVGAWFNARRCAWWRARHQHIAWFHWVLVCGGVGVVGGWVGWLLVCQHSDFQKSCYWCV